jgi:hypothetical protein
MHAFIDSLPRPFASRVPSVLISLVLGAGLAAGQSTTFAARLQGSQVVPPVTTPGSGTASVVLDVGTGAVTITGSFSSLSSDVTIVALHGPAAVGSTASSIFSFSFSGTTSGTFTGSSVLAAAQVQDLLNGLHYVDIHTVSWPNSEVRGQVCPLASATTRNAGTNPASFAANPPVLGALWTASVDLTTSGHAFALVFGFDSPVSITLGGGQTLLCLDLLGNGEILGQTLVAGPVANVSVLVPDDPSLCGLSVCTQAVHIGGVVPFRLSNAQDLVLGL